MVQSIVAGTNVTVDDTDPANPIISAVGGGGGGAVDSVNGQTGVVVLDQDDVLDGTTYKQYSATEKTKLAGIATGATANDTDANLKNRANHTGTQPASTISDFDTEVSNNVDVAANTAARHTHSNKAILDATTASFTTADETKLDGIEAGADVTDATNVAAAGAIMDGDFSTNGSMHRTAAGTYASRTITGTTNLITVTNGDGVAGNPTITIGNNVYRSGGTDVSVADGGTGRSTSTTPYGLIAAGTTATGALQTLPAGATDQILVGGGASALPSWQTATGTGAPVRQTSPTLTTPRLASAGSINDANGNELIKAPGTVASAVNEITVSNAAAFNPPSISATGDDPNISINMVPKGTGKLLAGGIPVLTTSNTEAIDNKSISGLTNTFTDIPSTGLRENFFRGRLQADTTNSAPTGLTIQHGWGYIVGNGTARLSKTVTFPTAFTSPPIVLVSFISAAATADGTPTSTGSFNVDWGSFRGAASDDITTSSFLMRLEAVANHSASFNFGFSWIAIGVV